ncbi:hypothetical protein SAMN04488535_1822 [Corynebacterium mycetoides]|uniref:DUF3109 family protein n=1 Tax=Corynebacterium mycetoides TaxID=38302 RepID=A0A1G9QBQ8_9CORY|nr:hypothetical protein [Corynebacterium mycetoides]SDM07795.1 hypothetical protein SAMN04488535_1822 [Corynebacterium mycetoides]
MNQPAQRPVYLGFPASSPAGRSILAGREAAPDFPREWFDFVDPADPNHLIHVDLTWLESTWSCRFGTPDCHGIDESLPEVGCCIHGAYLSDESDRDDLYNAVAQMPAKYWQLRPAETDSYIEAADPTELEPWLEWDMDDSNEAEDGEEPSLKTARVNGACIFANRADAETGPGCALHQWAVAEGLGIIGHKPEVCWQVPFSREDEWIERPDGAEILRTTIGEYDRRQWGGGGEDFDWWCTAAPNCHSPAGPPVWQSMKEELSTLIGAAAYAVVEKHCSARAELPAHARAVHPATAAQASNL